MLLTGRRKDQDRLQIELKPRGIKIVLGNILEFCLVRRVSTGTRYVVGIGRNMFLTTVFTTFYTFIFPFKVVLPLIALPKLTCF